MQLLSTALRIAWRWEESVRWTFSKTECLQVPWLHESDGTGECWWPGWLCQVQPHPVSYPVSYAYGYFYLFILGMSGVFTSLINKSCSSSNITFIYYLDVCYVYVSRPLMFRIHTDFYPRSLVDCFIFHICRLTDCQRYFWRIESSGQLYGQESRDVFRTIHGIS